jgi:hypothetical protein
VVLLGWQALEVAPLNLTTAQRVARAVARKSAIDKAIRQLLVATGRNAQSAGLNNLRWPQA